MTTYLVDTAEMPVWTGDEEPEAALYTWGSYTELGPFQPTWARRSLPTPYARRVEHSGRHNAKLRWGKARHWIASKAREIANALVGDFMPVAA